MNTKENVFNDVYQKYKEKLSNLDIPNNPILITFAAVPGSGITAISKKLEKELKGVRISSDDVQSMLQEYRGEEFYDGFILEKRDFIYWLVKKVVSEYDNKLIILDKSIDRSYGDIKDLAGELGIPFLVISLEAGREELVKRLKNLYGDYSINYINDLDRWIGEHEEFVESKNYDISIDTERNTIEVVLEKIGSFIRKKY